MLLQDASSTSPMRLVPTVRPGSRKSAGTKVTMSVVVPTSGRVDLLGETLASLTRQTFRDFEVVLTDDSANEADRRAIQQAAKKFEDDAQIAASYVFSKPRLYQAANTNQGLAHAEGSLIRILHSDDVLHPRAIEVEVETLTSEPGLEVLFEDIIPFEDQVAWQGDAPLTLVSPAHHLRTHLSFSTAVPSGLAFTASALRRAGLMDERLRFLCDWDLFCRLLLTQIESRQLVARFGPGLVGWRTHANSVSSSLWQTHFHEHELFIREFWQSERVKSLHLFNDHEEHTFRRVARAYRHRRARRDFSNLPVREKLRCAPWQIRHVLPEQVSPTRVTRNFIRIAKDARRRLAQRLKSTGEPSNPPASASELQSPPTVRSRSLAIAPFYDGRVLDSHSENWVVDYDNTLNLWTQRGRLADTQVVRFYYPNINRMYERTLHEVLKYIAVGNDIEIVMTGNHHLQWFGLKAVIAQQFPSQFTLVDQQSDQGGEWTIRFRRTAPVAPHYCEPHTGWTFGLLTLGDKPERALAYLDSIRESCNEPYEVIVVCPQRITQLEGREEVRQLLFDTRDDLGWITKKKNLICEAAQFSDILICHDRFTLSPTFCQSFGTWGYSYGMAAPRISLPDGRRSIDWAVVSSQNRTWSTGGLLDYRSHSPYVYVPGGATLVRKAFWQRFPWDENVFWNEHEDVELCRRAQRHGEMLLLADGQLVTLTDRWLDHNPAIPFCPDREILFGRPVGEQVVRYLPV